jgi:hypothetical protein
VLADNAPAGIASTAFSCSLRISIGGAAVPGPVAATTAAISGTVVDIIFEQQCILELSGTGAYA